MRHTPQKSRTMRFDKLRRRRGVIVVLASALSTVLFAFVAFGVDTGRMVMTQTHMQNAADAAALAASQEIMAAVRTAGDQGGGDVDLDINSIAISQSRQVAADVAAANGYYVDPDQDVQFGKRVFDHDSGKWELVWNEAPYNTVQVNIRRDNPDLDAPDAQLRMAFGFAVGKASMPITTSASAFIESRDMVLVLDFSSSMNDDSELRSVNRLGQTAIEDNLEDIYEALGPPEDGDLVFEPQFLTLESPDPSTPSEAKVHCTFKREKVHVTSTQNIEEVVLRFTNNQYKTYSNLNTMDQEFQGTGSNSSRDIKSVWVTSGSGAADPDPITVQGDAPTSNNKPQIYVTFDGDTIYVNSSKDLSNVVLKFENGVEYKFDGLSGKTGTFTGTGSNTGLNIETCWIKSGSNASGDGPGYGERFDNPQDFEGESSAQEFVFHDTNSNVKAAFGLDQISFPYPGGSWDSYINYARSNYYVKQAGYRQMYGGLSLVNYLLDGRNRNSQCPDLWKTPHYPFHAVKNGATLFTEFLTDLDFGDELGLVTYDTNSRVEKVLDEDDAQVDISADPITPDFAAINTIQRHKQAGHYGATTGMGYAIDDARELMMGDEDSNKPAYRREGSRLTMIIMTDGQANQYPNGWQLPGSFSWSEWTDFDGDGSADYSTNDRAKQYSFYQATRAIEQGIILHTMSVGAGSDSDLMDAIAKAGNGVHINIPGGTKVADMEEQLLEAFGQMAAHVPPPKLVFDGP